MKDVKKVMTIKVYRAKDDKSYGAKVTFNGVEVDAALSPAVVVESMARFINELECKEKEVKWIGKLALAKALADATECLTLEEGGKK